MYTFSIFVCLIFSRCGCTLISDQWVLTARHCTIGEDHRKMQVSRNLQLTWALLFFFFFIVLVIIISSIFIVIVFVLMVVVIRSCLGSGRRQTDRELRKQRD